MNWEDEAQPIPNKPSLDEVAQALRSIEFDATLPATLFYGLSELNGEEVQSLLPVWQGLGGTQRINVLRQLVDSSETNFELDYFALAVVGLDDVEPSARVAAVELLWADESIEIMDRLHHIAQTDSDENVRASAINALGRYILAGELGDLPEEQTLKVQETVMSIFRNESEPLEIRRRALEAAANSSSNDTELDKTIREAYSSRALPMQASALFAMGRTCDEKWGDIIIRELENTDSELRFEAARAAGEMLLETAIPKLNQAAFDVDTEVRDTAIWALGEIGGREALRILNILASDPDNQEDDDLMEAIEDAIANAQLAGDGTLYLLDYDDK
jgi:HEAT repeat protein